MTIPKFSEALLLGLPEIFFTNSVYLAKTPTLAKFPAGDKECVGCLIGAALYAVGEKQSLGQPLALIFKYWPWTRTYRPPSTCPFCNTANWSSKLFTAYVSHLAWHYDIGEVTAEQIADLFRAIEPVDEPVAEEVAETADEYQCT